MKRIKIYVNPDELSNWKVGMELKFMSHFYHITERTGLIESKVEYVDYYRSTVELSYESDLYVDESKKIDVYEIKSYERVR